MKLNIRRIPHAICSTMKLTKNTLARPLDGPSSNCCLQDGMAPEAAGRVLCAGTEGQGVTGYVAATGQRLSLSRYGRLIRCIYRGYRGRTVR